MQTLGHRVATGSWDSLATAAQLTAAAQLLPGSLGGSAFIPFCPDALTGASSPLTAHYRL